MKSILILRHAKSSWKHPDVNDHDRPLNKRGKRDAPYMGELLQDKHLVPDFIISSTAKELIQQQRPWLKPPDIRERLL